MKRNYWFATLIAVVCAVAMVGQAADTPKNVSKPDTAASPAVKAKDECPLIGNDKEEEKRLDENGVGVPFVLWMAKGNYSLVWYVTPLLTFYGDNDARDTAMFFNPCFCYLRAQVKAPASKADKDAAKKADNKAVTGDDLKVTSYMLPLALTFYAATEDSARAGDSAQKDKDAKKSRGFFSLPLLCGYYNGIDVEEKDCRVDGAFCPLFCYENRGPIVDDKTPAAEKKKASGFSTLAGAYAEKKDRDGKATEVAWHTFMVEESDTARTITVGQCATLLQTRQTAKNADASSCWGMLMESSATDSAKDFQVGPGGALYRGLNTPAFKKTEVAGGALFSSESGGDYHDTRSVFGTLFVSRQLSIGNNDFSVLCGLFGRQERAGRVTWRFTPLVECFSDPNENASGVNLFQAIKIVDRDTPSKK